MLGKPAPGKLKYECGRMSLGHRLLQFGDWRLAAIDAAHMSLSARGYQGPVQGSPAHQIAPARLGPKTAAIWRNDGVVFPANGHWVLFEVTFTNSLGCGIPAKSIQLDFE